MKTLNTPLGTFDIYDTGTITRTLEAGQWWDRHVGEVLEETAGGWALDLGAHVGWFTVHLAQRHEHVIAVEPFPETFRLLGQNLQIHHGGLCETVERWPVAAYSYPVRLVYADWLERTDRGANCYLPVDYTQPTDLRRAEVVGIRLDDYLPPTCPITCIKVDCQGADLHALMGLEQTIRRCKPLIVLEWEEGLAASHGHGWDCYMKWADRMGYRLERITPSYWDYVLRPIGEVLR